MLYPRPTPLNRRSGAPNLPDLHRRHPPAQRVRSSATCRREPLTPQEVYMSLEPARNISETDESVAAKAAV